MIDREARDVLAENLRHLVSGRITNEEFEDKTSWNEDYRLLKSGDPAIGGIFWSFAWCLYSDTWCYRLRGRDALTAEVLRVAAHCIVFLHSDFEYEWPRTPKGVWPPWGLGGLLFYLAVGLALAFAAWGRGQLGDPITSFFLAALAAIIMALVAYQLAVRDGCKREERCFREAGDFEAWPFLRSKDCEEARRSPRLLAGHPPRGGKAIEKCLLDL